jgi:hypothetical protein
VFDLRGVCGHENTMSASLGITLSRPKVEANSFRFASGVPRGVDSFQASRAPRRVLFSGHGHLRYFSRVFCGLLMDE